MAAAQDDGAEFSTLDMGMAERPASDPVALERARARIEQTMFGAARPARLGRYEILEPIAGGGMGLVYSAYDPELHRRVALKVLHPGRDQEPHAHDRLLQEARALARLDHQNVVKIHDVLSADGQIVVVMALLEGVTLTVWEHAMPRDWRAVVDAYAQAGDGLAAAHSLDIIHRDFKPSNAIISSAGHVRVLDFGLARLALGPSDERRPQSGAQPAIHETWTVTGAFLGTLAFASPEQLAGERVTAASDQFSFCVALHQALEGIAPFEGSSLEELAANIHRGAVRVAPDGRRTPAWLAKALRRGLSADPAARFPSMTALLAELRRPRGWKRWRWPLATGLVAASAIAVVGFTRGDAIAACDGGAAQLGAVWGPPARAALATRLGALPGPFARDVEARVVGGLDSYANDWSAAHRGACLAHRRGEASDQLLDHEMRCLDRHLGDLAAAVGVLGQTDAEHAGDAPDVVVGIPSLRACTDPAGALDELEPPATPAMQAEVARIRDLVSRATALDHAGRSEQALALATGAGSAADATGYKPLIAEVDLELGRILIGREELGAAANALHAAKKAALGGGRQARIAVEAGARLIYAEGMSAPDLPLMERDLEYLEPMSASLEGDQFARALLFNNVAQVYRILQRVDQARRYLKLAGDAAGPDPDIELVVVGQTLASLSSDPAQRMQLTRAAWERTRTVLGEHHLRTLRARAQYAVFQVDPARALEVIAPVCDEYAREHASLPDAIIDCQSVRAFVASESGDAAQANAAYASIVAASKLPSEMDHAVDRQLAIAEMAFADGRLAAARAGFQDVDQTHKDRHDWWERVFAYQAELGLARILLAESRPAYAAPYLEAAATGFEEIARTNPVISYVLRAETARRLLASNARSSEQQASGIH